MHDGVLGVQVHEFVFYVFCEMLPHGHEMFGYFSREKRSDSNHLACILTMPHKQRKGYGGLIIDYSYKLARRENKPGTPERPLSDLGWVRFTRHLQWRWLSWSLLRQCAYGKCLQARLWQHSSCGDFV